MTLGVRSRGEMKSLLLGLELPVGYQGRSAGVKKWMGCGVRRKSVSSIEEGAEKKGGLQHMGTWSAPDLG